MKAKNFTLFLIFFLLTACAKTIQVPDVSGVDVDSAKALLIKNDILPRVEYKYSNEFEEGITISSDPEVGSKLELNSTITLFVSKGRELIISNNASTILYDIYGVHNFDQDDFEFVNPKIIRDNLIIEYTINFNSSKNFSWYDLYNSGEGMGTARIVSEGSKEINLKVKYPEKDIKERTKHKFTLEIPLQDLDNKKPTKIEAYIWVDVEGTTHRIQLDFTITW